MKRILAAGMLLWIGLSTACAAKPQPAATTLGDLKSRADDTGVLLSYDDGTSEGKWSTAGSGHAVLFQAPQGEWLVDRVEVFGSRYGTPEPPQENFSIYLCDEDFSPVKEFERPYAFFERGEHQWVKLGLPATSVPRRFYVCLGFNPTATKGVYVAYDESVPRSHSRSALPYSHVADVRGKFDWMIRVHLQRAPG
jgi:RNA polymerase sigma-70 factor (ECF subfamily)